MVFRARLGDLVGGARGAQTRAQAEQGMAAAGFSPLWMVLATRFEA